MKSLDFKLTKLTFNDNLTINLDSGSIVVIVGPNNSGKTTILSEIEQKLQDPDEEGLNLSKVDANIKVINTQELENHFINELNLIKDSSYGADRFKGYEIDINWSWPKEKTEIRGSIISAFVLYVDTMTRLSVVEPTNNISLTKDALIHPMHYLLRYEQLEEQLNEYVKEVFNFNIILHPFPGQKITLLIGELPKLIGDETRFEKVQKYDSMDELVDQGDGVKAYVGVLLTLIASVQKVILIDEPENFLHPPQSNRLGRLIGNHSQSKEKQIFISTHSSNFLKGLLESNHSNLQLIRITKQHSINLLDNKICQEIWNEDPVLKSSNLLDGLFHDAVIICESDVDVKFYSIVLDQILDNNQDILFVASYGKEKMIKMQSVLSKLKIANKCIIDFDAICDRNFIQNICKVNGIGFESIRLDYEPIYQFLKDKDKDDIKRAGKQILSSGIQNNYDRLNTIFKDNNIFLVEVGELERFVKTKSGKSGKWMFEVISDFDTLLIKNELSEAISFIRNVLSSIDRQKTNLN
jgi:AAA15 family ATPase/GTPase